VYTTIEVEKIGVKTNNKRIYCKCSKCDRCSSRFSRKPEYVRCFPFENFELETKIKMLIRYIIIGLIGLIVITLVEGQQWIWTNYIAQQLGLTIFIVCIIVSGMFGVILLILSIIFLYRFMC
jgi:hypothetical protein